MTPHFESEHRILHADGRYRWVLCRGLAVWDALGRATRMAGSQTDITRHKALEEQLVHDAFHDALSGLPNRALFTDRLGRAVERAKRYKGSGFAVLLLDLDRFGAINVRGGVPPAEFIPVAEETGQIVPLGLWVLREACRQGREWLDRFGDAAVPISVNVSSRQLADDGFVECARDVLAITGLPGRLLTLEITESSLMDCPASVASRLERLRALGVRVSVDDFGMGHSCLSLLHTVPIDTLKIDRSFVARIGPDGTSPATVRTVVALAHSLGMDAVAEGVEGKGQLEALRALSCGFAQGNFFSQPLPAAGATQALQEARRW
jgi:EAL domain-containing protein (putative c-di-GMP-specific phosphodiesterase class I)